MLGGDLIFKLQYPSIYLIFKNYPITACVQNVGKEKSKCAKSKNIVGQIMAQLHVSRRGCYGE